jgi:rSAM/selenodomain-associated transferase 1
MRVPEKCRTLAVVAKQPIAGRVKTRLAAATSPIAAAEIAQAFLLDTLDRFREVPARRVLAYDPPSAISYFRHTAGEGYELVAQSAGDLGDRLRELFVQEFHRGATGVLALGIDSPTLPTSFVAEASEKLTDADAVIGPTMDGGYYLVGCSRLLPTIFSNIPWGTASVFHLTVDRLRECGASVALLPTWYDVDTLDDWRFLGAHVSAMRLAGIDPHLPRTEELLGRL